MESGQQQGTKEERDQSILLEGIGGTRLARFVSFVSSVRARLDRQANDFLQLRGSVTEVSPIAERVASIWSAARARFSVGRRRKRRQLVWRVLRSLLSLILSSSLLEEGREEEPFLLKPAAFSLASSMRSATSASRCLLKRASSKSTSTVWELISNGGTSSLSSTSLSQVRTYCNLAGSLGWVDEAVTPPGVLGEEAKGDLNAPEPTQCMLYKRTRPVSHLGSRQNACPEKRREN